MIAPVLDLFAQVWTTFINVWPFLLASIVVASVLVVYVAANRLAGWLSRSTPIAVPGAVTLATLTPSCSCGTTVVVLGAMASHVPWAPVVAFMVSSPLTSPEEYVLSTGLFGLPFATTFFVAAIVLGLAAGIVTFLIERTGWLAGQSSSSSSAYCSPAPSCSAGLHHCGCNTTSVATGPAPGIRCRVLMIDNT